MPRTPRLDHPGARHHVMNRIARKEAIFLDDAVCAMFLDVVGTVPARFGARIHGYALMPNHYHLLVETPRANLSDVMRHIGAAFTQAFNREREHDGPLFRGRFRNRLVERDDYWVHLLAYLHLNPVRAGLATSPDGCLWTSHDAYLGRVRRPDWLTCAELLGLFGSREALSTYVDELQRKRRPAPAGFEPESFWAQATTASVPAQPAPVPRSAEGALEEVAEVCGMAPAAVLARPRGRKPNTAAWLAAWWLARSTPLGQNEIAKLMAVSRGRVSQLQHKLHALARADEGVREAMRALEARLEPAG